MSPRIGTLTVRLGPGARRRREAKIQRRREAGHVPPTVTQREDPELARARTERLGSRLFDRVRDRIAKMLGPDASAGQKRKAAHEAAKFLGLSSGAAPDKKASRRRRQASQRRNR